MAEHITPPLPVSTDWLNTYRLRVRDLGRTAGYGAHVTSRAGQSLEFREIAPYSFGDDIRHVDPIATARAHARSPIQGPLGTWMTRHFHAEEHYKLVVSIDQRMTMGWPRTLPRGPLALPKLDVARWIAIACGRIGVEFGDRLVFHGLFGGNGDVRDLQRARGRELEAAIEGVSQPDRSREAVNIRPLDLALRSAAVWLIVTDLYADIAQLELLRRRMDEAGGGRRAVLLIELDSWPYEKAMIGRGPRRIDGPGSVSKQVQVDDDVIRQVEGEIGARRRIFDSYRSVSRWSWPEQFADDTAFRSFFAERFAEDPLLRQIFMRGS